MSSIRIEQTGEMEELLRRLDSLADIRAGDITGAIAEGVRTRTMERFAEEKTRRGNPGSHLSGPVPQAEKR